MVKRILLLSMAVVWVSGQKAQPCCYPEQWESVTSAYRGFGHAPESLEVEYVYGTISVDLKNNNKTFFGEFHEDLKLHILRDYTMLIEYFIDPNNKTCNQVPILAEAYTHERCIPDSAVYTGRSYFGFKSSDYFSFDSFLIGNSSEDRQTVSITTDTCAPISRNAHHFIPDQISLFEEVAYLNATTGIKDPSVFDLPSYCNSVEKPIFFKAPIESYHHYRQLFKKIYYNN